MRILLDTCAFLWIISDDPKLSALARKLFLDLDNEIYLSAVSTWEISLKFSLGRLSFPENPQIFIPTQRKSHGVETLPLEEEATLYLKRLPELHDDPFDRMLICQAIVHGMLILTPDELISQYPVRTTW
ncbi:MAG: type II toxin-antitoxin system VapC family toxin [bacterium]